MSALRRIHLIVEGRVQGVGYRAYLARMAASLGVTGWVRNNDDGTVEAEAQGTDDALASLVAVAKKGPFLARVDRVHVEDAPPAPSWQTRFEVVH